MDAGAHLHARQECKHMACREHGSPIEMCNGSQVIAMKLPFKGVCRVMENCSRSCTPACFVSGHEAVAEWVNCSRFNIHIFITTYPCVVAPKMFAVSCRCRLSQGMLLPCTHSSLVLRLRMDAWPPTGYLDTFICLLNLRQKAGSKCAGHCVIVSPHDSLFEPHCATVMIELILRI